MLSPLGQPFHSQRHPAKGADTVTPRGPRMVTARASLNFAVRRLHSVALPCGHIPRLTAWRRYDRLSGVLFLAVQGAIINPLTPEPTSAQGLPIGAPAAQNRSGSPVTISLAKPLVNIPTRADCEANPKSNRRPPALSPCTEPLLG